MALHQKRVAKEFATLRKCSLEQDGIAVELPEAMDENSNDAKKQKGSSRSASSSSGDPRAVHMTALIAGPKDSPYEGGVFRLQVSLPSGYPLEPPKIKFQTRIYHPNVGQGHTPGAICLDILRKEAWSPSLSLERTLISIASLLSDPNPNSPLDGEAAKLYKTDRKAYDREVQKWVRLYAEGKKDGDQTGTDAWQADMGKPDDDAPPAAGAAQPGPTPPSAPPPKKRKTARPPTEGSRAATDFGPPPAMDPEWARPVVIDLDLEDD